MIRNAASSIPRVVLDVGFEKKGLFDSRRDVRFGNSPDKDETTVESVMALWDRLRVVIDE